MRLSEITERVLLYLCILGTMNASALTVVVSNVVHAYQSEDQRREYLGRQGESVYNTDAGTLTLFDGVNKGGTPLAESITPTSIFVCRHNHMYPDDGSNGSNLVAVVNQAVSYSANEPNQQYFRPTVIIESGSYDLGGQTLVISNAINLVSSTSVFIPQGFSSNKGIEWAADFAYPEVLILADDTLMNLTTSPYECRFSGINFFTGDIIGQANVAHAFIGCTISGDMFTDTNSKAQFYHSRILGNICKNAQFLGNAYQTYFGTASNFGESTSGASEVIGCYIRGTNTFDVGAFTTFGTYKDCEIDGSDIFNGDGVVFQAPTFRNCSFVNTSTNWFSGSVTLFSSPVFQYCTGVSSSITNNSCKLLYCSDENGNPLPNQ